MERIGFQTGDRHEALDPLRMAEDAKWCRYSGALPQSQNHPAHPEYLPPSRNEVYSTTSMVVPLWKEPDQEDVTTIPRLQKTSTIDAYCARSYSGVKVYPDALIPPQTPTVTVRHEHRRLEELRSKKSYWTRWSLSILRWCLPKTVRPVTVGNWIEHETGRRKLRVLTSSLLLERQERVKHNLRERLAQPNEETRFRIR